MSSSVRVRALVIGSLLTAALAAATACQPTPTPAPPPVQPSEPTQPSQPPAAAHDVVVNKELMITNLSVVNDARTKGPDWPWSFGALMTRMAGPTDPSAFVVKWLQTWENDQPVNGFSIPKRAQIRKLVIEPWMKKDNGGQTVPDESWKVNFANAPFRLLAIVNRLDLMRETTTSVANAGEGRFVFGVLGPAGEALPFTVIFEFEQLATTREQLRGWAQQWHALGTTGSAPFDETYKAALQVITDRFSGSNAAPNKPNGSALNQLRTNEIALVIPENVSRGWELREFHIANGLLTPATTRQSPSNSFQNNAVLTEFINVNEAAIIDGTFEILPTFKGQPFLAASSIIAPPVTGFRWIAPPTVNNNEARFKVAFGSCNGCHHMETATTNFVHVDNRAATSEAALSKFLTGEPDGSDFKVDDQGVGGFKRPFNDLKQRAAILKATAEEAGAVQLHSLRANRRFRVH
jgi:hypothetical protein